MRYDTEIKFFVNSVKLDLFNNRWWDSHLFE